LNTFTVEQCSPRERGWIGSVELTPKVDAFSSVCNYERQMKWSDEKLNNGKLSFYLWMLPKERCSIKQSVLFRCGMLAKRTVQKSATALRQQK